LCVCLKLYSYPLRLCYWHPLFLPFSFPFCFLVSAFSPSSCLIFFVSFSLSFLSVFCLIFLCVFLSNFYSVFCLSFLYVVLSYFSLSLSFQSVFLYYLSVNLFVSPFFLPFCLSFLSVFLSYLSFCLFVLALFLSSCLTLFLSSCLSFLCVFLSNFYSVSLYVVLSKLSLCLSFLSVFLSDISFSMFFFFYFFLPLQPYLLSFSRNFCKYDLSKPLGEKTIKELNF